MKSIHIFSRTTPLTDVRGRVKYATSPDKQEHLLAVAGETDPAFWTRLATESQLAWRAAGGNRKKGCREGREIFLTLPNSAEDEDLQALAKELADGFTERYGAPCLVAIHKNKTESSLHYHLIFCDRKLLAEPEIRVADRNVFLDENGIRRRTKKEILDADGTLRPGCSIVPKGEILSERHFGERDDIFASKEWLDNYNHYMADWINERLQPDKKRIVYDPNGPYLPQHRIPKGTPPEQEARIRKYNRVVRSYNELVESCAVEPERARAIKGMVMLSPNNYEALEAAIYPQNVISAVPGGQRTQKDPTDPVEQKKQELRELYRKSNLAWKEYRRLPDGVDKKIALSRARGISAQIDETKRYLGMYTYEEYQEILRKEEADRCRAIEAVMRYRAKANWYVTKQQICKRAIDKCYRELMEIPILFADEGDWARRRELWAKIEELEAAKERYAALEIEAYIQEKRARKEEREQRKKLRETRREARQQKKKEKAQEHTSTR